MLSFRQFLIESALPKPKTGLPHITTMNHKQYSSLIGDGKIDLSHVTEKTDGSSFLFGHDEHGFYSMYSGSGSEKMRHANDYVARSTRRAQETGKLLDLTAAHNFGNAHSILQNNPKLQTYLKSKADQHGETRVKGELFYKPLGRPSDTHKGHIKFVGTSYSPAHMGSMGKIVVHSRLPENAHHDLEHLVSTGDSHINFDHDVIKLPSTHVDVSSHLAAYDSHLAKHAATIAQKLSSKNRDAKLQEHDDFTALKQKLSDEVDKHITNLGMKPKWGPETEGAVVHPNTPNKPRFKVTSSAFRRFKKATKGLSFSQIKASKVAS